MRNVTTAEKRVILLVTVKMKRDPLATTVDNLVTSQVIAHRPRIHPTKSATTVVISGTSLRNAVLLSVTLVPGVGQVSVTTVGRSVIWPGTAMLTETQTSKLATLVARWVI